MTEHTATRNSSAAFPALPLIALAALGTALPWWFPDTWGSAVLAWAGAAALVPMVERSARPYRAAFSAGAVVHAPGFYWLYGTIRDFGGFPPPAAGAVFLLFVAGSATQFLVFAFIFRNLPHALDRFALRAAPAWVASEFLSIRIFPWMIGHTQLAFPALAQAADLAGVGTISFVMVWAGESIYRSVRGAPRGRAYAAPIVFLLCLTAYGYSRLGDEGLRGGAEVPVAIIQANVSIEEKRDMKFIVSNRERYEALTREIASSGMLVIWPESVIQEFIHDKIRLASHDPRLPRFEEPISLLIGALTAESRSRYFNSALAVLETGEVLEPYHKRILMPFGEYTPFGELLPFIAELNSTAGGFTPGESTAVFRYPLGEREIGVSPLICYEDILPSLSRDAVNEGAELLVNITNDAWFGDTIAPYQHHLIAAFRAIENRRYLIRATNTGLTAVVDPYGRTVSSLPPFSEGVLRTNVRPSSRLSLFARVGERPWWVLSIAALFAAVLRSPLFRRRRAAV